MWSEAVHSVHWLRGFLKGAGKGQPPPVFSLGLPGMSYTAICTWLLLELGLEMPKERPRCEPRLAARSARPEVT